MSLYEKLFPWQKNIINKIKDKESFGLFLDMGLGKTILSLSLAEVNQCEKLIVITINGKATEKKEIKGSWFDWANQSNMNWILSDKTTKDFSPENEMLLINYEALYKRVKKEDLKKNSVILQDKINDFLKSCINKKTCIIIDESHKLKDLQSKQTKSILAIQRFLKLRAKSLNTYLLTGTPFTTGYIDLYAQLKILGCELNKGEFEEAFCVRGNVYGLLGWQQPIIGYKNLDKLFELIHRFAITIKSDEVVDLPKQIFVNHYTEQSDEFKMFTNEKAYVNDIDSLAKKLNVSVELPNVKKKINNVFYRNIDYPSFDWLADTTGAFWLRCRELSIGFQGNAEKSKWYDRRRLDQLKTFLERNEDNYVLFYNYTPEMLEIYQICDELGYNIDVYCGEIKSEFYYTQYLGLSESDKLTHKKNIILANFSSGSTGKNWQAYNKCIIFSLPLFKDWQQGVKRVHREGQKFDVIYHVFKQDNWLDNAMQEALDKQIDYDDKMFANGLEKIRREVQNND